MLRKLSIKIYLAMILLAIILTGALLAYIDWIFTHGYSHYVSVQGQQIEEAFRKRLVPIYEKSGNWDEVRGNRRLWGGLSAKVAQEVDPDHKEHLQSLHSSMPPGNSGPPPRERRPPKEGFDRPSGPPPRPGPHDYRGGEKNYSQKDLKALQRRANRLGMPSMPIPSPAARFILIDENRRHLGGPPFYPSSLKLTPLKTSDGKIIGYTGMELSDRTEDPLTLVFFEDNLPKLVGVVIGIIVIALIVTLPLARMFLMPIQALRKGAEQLVEGKYNKPIKVNTNDELADLGDDLNQLAKRLAKNEEDRKQWVADISHELRTPLSVLKINIEALEDGINEPSPEAFALLQTRVRMLGKLIDDLHELSISDLGAHSYHFEHVDVINILNASLRAFNSDIEASGLTLDTFGHKAESFLTLGDEKRLSQVFNNLLGNAIKYTDAPGTVRVTTRVDGKQLVLQIEDSAPGVPEQSLDKIFDRLYRVDASRNRKTGGSGLGLAITRNIVEAHLGSIKAETSHLGGILITLILEENHDPTAYSDS